MALKQFGSHELPPLNDPIIHTLINQDLIKQRDAEGPLATADGTIFRASDAMMCARAVAMNVIEWIPDDLEIPPEVLMTFDVGHRFHERTQGILEREIGAMSEVTATYLPETSLSCHADSVYCLASYTGELPLDYLYAYNPDAIKVAVEIKTVSGFGWLLATGGRKSDDGAGPKVEHVCQAALSANAPNVQAQYIHIIYIDKDKQGIAEWFLDMDEPLERYSDLSPRQLAEQEIKRIHGIAERVFDQDMLPTRFIPGFGRVEKPPAAGSRNDPWHCKYCRHQPTCAQLVTMPVPLADLRTMLERKAAADGSPSEA